MCHGELVFNRVPATVRGAPLWAAIRVFPRNERAGGRVAGFRLRVPATRGDLGTHGTPPDPAQRRVRSGDRARCLDHRLRSDRDRGRAGAGGSVPVPQVLRVMIPCEITEIAMPYWLAS